MGTPRISNAFRIEQTRCELDLLWSEIDEWLEKRRRKDALKQYATQLDGLETILTTALGALREVLEGLTADRPAGEVYSGCRIHERRLFWIRRIWEYFRTKFDQREDSNFAAVLSAADEVVWSCYAEVLYNARSHLAEVPLPSAPLPYLEPRFSPQATPRVDPPRDLKSEVDATFLQDYLRQLPIPVVSLPTSCAHSPWWLIYLGHEVGHHIQYDLLPNWQMVKSFGLALQSVVEGDADGTAEEAVRWQRWGIEVFADTFSILTMGPWALWAITELELSDERTMLTPRPQYPPPLVRLALMGHMVRGLDMDDPVALGHLNLEPLAKPLAAWPRVLVGSRDLRESAARELKLVPRIVAAALESTPGGLGTLAQLCGWNRNDFVDGGAVYHWREALCGRRPLIPEPTLRAPRLIISGAVAAFTELSTIEDSAIREDTQAKLAEDLISMVAKSREEGTRAGALLRVRAMKGYGDELARLLLDSDPTTLGGQT